MGEWIRVEDREIINALREEIDEATYPVRPLKFMFPLELAEQILALLRAKEPKYPVCERCGKQIDHINTSVFQYDGTDSEYQTPITFDEKNGCVVFETTQNWTSYELTDEERKEGIRCPHCGEYPFDSSVEIELYEPVEVLMWTSKQTDAQLDYEAAVEMAECCEHYESTYNSEDGSM